MDDQQFAAYRQAVRDEIDVLQKKVARLETSNAIIGWFLKATVVAWITALAGGFVTAIVLLVV